MELRGSGGLNPDNAFLAGGPSATVGRRLIASAFLLISIVYLIGIRGHSFWAENEAYYTLAAKSVRSGHFLLPIFSEDMPIDKPPLACWWIALVAAPFGKINEVTARLANVIPALLALWLTFRFAALNISRTTALLATLVLATCYEFWENSLEVSTDLALLALLVLCWAHIFAILEGGFTWRRWLLTWIPMGLATMTKGPVAIALSGIIAVSFSLLRYGWRDGSRRLFQLRPVIGLPLCLFPIVAWCAAVYFVHGAGPLQDIIFRQSVTRFMTAFNHQEPWYYLLKEFPMNLLPWTVLLPVVVLQWIGRARRGEDQGSWRWFCVICNVVVLVFFSLSSAKRDYYLLPLMPWAALLIADTITAGSRNETAMSPRAKWGIATGFALLVILGAYSLIAFPRLEARRSVLPFVRKAELECWPGATIVFFGNEDPRIFYYFTKKYVFVEDNQSGYDTLNQLIAWHQQIAARGPVDILFSHDVLQTIKNTVREPLYIVGVEKIRQKPYYIATTAIPSKGILLTDDYIKSQQN